MMPALPTASISLAAGGAVSLQASPAGRITARAEAEDGAAAVRMVAELQLTPDEARALAAGLLLAAETAADMPLQALQRALFGEARH